MLCTLLAVVALASAQQPSAERRAVVLTAANLSRGGAQSQYQSIITDALSVETDNAGFQLVSPERWEQARVRLGIAPEDLLLGPNALVVARAVDAEVAATGFYRIDDSRIVVEVKFYDVREERLAASAVRSGRIGLAVSNLVNAAVLDAVSWLEGPSGLVPQDPSSRGVRSVALLSADEGAELFVGGRRLATITEGRAVVPTATSDLEVTVEGRKPGFHPRSQRVRVAVDTETTLRPLRSETRWGAELLYTSGQLVGLGLGLRYYFEPDKTFLSCDDYFYVQSTFTDRASAVFHDDVRFLIGRYLFLGPYSPVRLGLAAGVGGIVTVFADRGVGDSFDAYLSPVNLWVEWNTRRWSVYWRVEGKYAVETGSSLLDRGWLEIPQAGPPMTAGVVYKW